MRISEALALRTADVDWEQGLLVIRQSKYHHTRLVPLHATTLAVLREYARQRQKLFPEAQHFFVSDRGRRFAYTTVRRTFRTLACGMTPNSGQRYVRLHDLRHTFACRILLHWQRSLRGATGRLAILSRYLGHERISSTYWYLTAVPELLREAARSFESHPDQIS